jgi:hypothetical protein
VATPAFRERDPSRPFTVSRDGADIALHYFCSGTADPEEVRQLALVNTPRRFGFLIRTEVKADPQGGGLWYVDVSYALVAGQPLSTEPPEPPEAPSPDEPMGPDFSFELAAESVHITQSLSTTQRRTATDTQASGVNLTLHAVDANRVQPAAPDTYVMGGGDVGRTLFVTGGAGWVTGTYAVTAVGGGYWTLDANPAPGKAGGWNGGAWSLLTGGAGSAPDQKGAIGVTKDRIEGCDISVPTGRWSRATPVVMTPRFMRTIHDTIGKVNHAAYYGFARGEVLYLGCSGKLRNGLGAVWDVTHSFAISRNRTGIDVGGGIFVPAKLGWEYLWVGYKPAIVGNNLLQIPDAAYVEKVYEFADLAVIGIGS